MFYSDRIRDECLNKVINDTEAVISITKYQK